MKLTEEQIRKITLSAINELGENANPALVKDVVANAISKLNYEPQTEQEKIVDSGRVILTSFGVNRPGVVAQITANLSDARCDIRDISQKIMDEFYTLIMIVDITSSPLALKDIQEKLSQTAEELKVKIYLQHEDLFRHMHRI